MSDNMGNVVGVDGFYGNKSESINELAMALCKAQQAMGFAVKDSSNPFFKSKYADLASVWGACSKPLSENKLSVSQLVNGLSEKGGIILETVLMHESGQWIKSTIEMIPADLKPQTFGSTLTYARRYALSAIVGVIQDDDDGNTASGLTLNSNIQKTSKGNYEKLQIKKTSSEFSFDGDEDEQVRFSCVKCGSVITKAEDSFSIKIFGKSLCRKHQEEARDSK